MRVSVNIPLTLLALCVSLLAAAQSPATDTPAQSREKILKAMITMGSTREQMARCGVADSNLSGIVAVYNSALDLATLASSVPSAGFRLQRGDVELAFSQGMSEASRLQITQAQCGQLVAGLPRFNQIANGASQMISGLLKMLGGVQGTR